MSLLCDSGDRYLDKYYDDSWLDAEGIDIEPYRTELLAFLDKAHPPVGDGGGSDQRFDDAQRLSAP